jgi:hypothetical protein
MFVSPLHPFHYTQELKSRRATRELMAHFSCWPGPILSFVNNGFRIPRLVEVARGLSEFFAACLAVRVVLPGVLVPELVTAVVGEFQRGPLCALNYVLAAQPPKKPALAGFLHNMMQALNRGPPVQFIPLSKRQLSANEISGIPKLTEVLQPPP